MRETQGWTICTVVERLGGKRIVMMIRIIEKYWYKKRRLDVPV
jgi:hypothetical protein